MGRTAYLCVSCLIYKSGLSIEAANVQTTKTQVHIHTCVGRIYMYLFHVGVFV